MGHGLRGEATSGSTLHIHENKIKVLLLNRYCVVNFNIYTHMDKSVNDCFL